MELSTILLEGIRSGSGDEKHKSLPQLLNAIRQHLKMDVAFISEFENGRRVFRQVDPAGPANPVQPGASDPLEESYCQRVVDGRLPELMRDARENSVAAALPVTHALPVGGHISVPIRTANGNVYGTFCCFSHSPHQMLDERDLNMMRVFADIAAQMIDCERSNAARLRELEERIDAAILNDSLSLVYQPIYDLEQRVAIGFEALSRFSGELVRSPDVWFREANEVGRGAELEAKAIRLAIQSLRHFPDEVYVSINMSPEHVIAGALDGVLRDMPLDRLVLEITEHAVVEHYDDVANTIRPFRDRGLQIAVDDAGAGYASFRHILNLAPDRIKLDISLTRNVDSDISRRALAAAFARFSKDTGTGIVAEGVETAAEMNALRDLGVSKIQGFYVARPMGLDTAVKMCGNRVSSLN